MNFTAITHTTATTYGNRSAAFLTGKFLHNSGSFAAFEDRDGNLSLLALPTVIQSARYNGLGQTGELPVAKAGDIVQVDLIAYRIVDEVRGQNPRLVRV